MARTHVRPEEQALLAAVIETPDDDAPRLIYADWLEENGDSDADRARAEFIREQIRKCAQEGDSWVFSEGSQRLSELRRAHGKVWERGLPAWVPRKAQYRRGFIERVFATARQFLKDGAKLRQLIPLRGLYLERPAGLLDEVCASGLLLRLRSLHLDDPRLTPDDVSALTRCSDLNGLTRLGMGRCHIGSAGVITLASAAWLVGLDVLYLLGNDIRLDGARALAAVPFRGLKYVNLQSNAVGDHGVALLLRSPHLPTHLVELNLAYNQLGPAGARALADCVRLRCLRRLELMNNYLGDEGATALLGAPHLAGLQLLGLRETQITDAGAAALAASPNLAGLMELNLYGNPIVGPGIFSMLASTHLKGLSRLFVYSPRHRQDEAALLAVRERFDKR
jgi:uncharacterized protein (TIGR02996 family)